MRQEHKIIPKNIKEVIISINPYYLNICTIARPRSGLEMKFSLSMTSALLLNDYNTASLETFSDKLCQSSLLKKFSEKIKIRTNLKVPKTASNVKIVLHRGQVFENYHDITNLTSVDQKANKLEKKISGILGQTVADRLWNELRSNKFNFADWMTQPL